MSIHDFRDFKHQAAETLSRVDGRRSVLISSGAAAIALFVVNLLTLLLDSGIANTGGLGGLGTRSLLSTAQSVLSLGLSLLLPFWGLGLVCAMLKLSRGQIPEDATLLEGFRRFFPALRLMILRGLVYICVCILCIQLVTPLLAMTPLAEPLLTLFSENPELLYSMETLDEATATAMTGAMLPILLICGAVCLIVLTPIFYSFRMADLRLMDDPKCGAIAALTQSARMMKGNRLSLLKLDLSFFWYYLAQLLILVLCNLPLIVPLPMDANWSYLLFSTLGAAAEVALYYHARCYVDVTYAKTYDHLKQLKMEH